MAKSPEEIGKYKILSCLGSGGTSIVYSATHPTLKRKVVIKKLNLRGSRQYYERFRQEASLMLDLNHDNIVRVYDHFKEGSRHYIVMEFVEGCSLDEILRKGGPLPPGTCRYILNSCCKALDYIHSRNIIHRDIKPSNIFISRDGHVKLGDFGIAQLEDSDENTGESTPVGTPAYMAPEQFLPKARITRKTDVYALGVSLYEMLTAEKMFDGASLEELRKKVLRGRRPFLFPLLFKKGVPLYWIVRKSVLKRKGLRFNGVRPVKRLLRLVAPKVRNSDARSILRLLVESAAGIKSDINKSAEVTESPSDIPGGRRKGLFLFLLLLLSLGSILFLSLKNGSFYRLFFQDRKGAVQIRLVANDVNFPHSGDLNLYRDKSSYLEPLQRLDLAGQEGFSEVYYLNSGNYRVMVRWGSQVEWILFYLPPLSQQGEDLLLLEIKSPEVPRKNLNIRSRISDALSGVSLDSRADLLVGLEDKWVSPGDLVLETGSSYRFMVSCPGYYPRYLNVPLQFYQDNLELKIQLIPVAGTLTVEHQLESLALLLDGKKTAVGGGMEKELLRFGNIEEGVRVWSLSPGDYKLDFLHGESEKSVSLHVEAGEEYYYSVGLKEGALLVELEG